MRNRRRGRQARCGPNLGRGGDGRLISPLHAPEPLRSPGDQLRGGPVGSSSSPLEKVNIRSFFAVAVDGDDRILVAGVAANAGDPDSGGAVARYEPDGSEDTSFAPPAETRSRIEDLLIDPTGTIPVTGYTRVTPSNSVPQVRRLLADGSPDPAFGAGERGRILISAVTSGPRRVPTASGFAIARLRPDGSLDPAFGKRGRALYAMTPHVKRESSVSLGLFVDGSDRPVLGGTVAAGSRRAGRRTNPPRRPRRARRTSPGRPGPGPYRLADTDGYSFKAALSEVGSRDPHICARRESNPRPSA